MSYPCLLFTNISIDDPSIARFKYEMGWVVVGGVLFNVGVNMLIMIVLNVKMVRQALSRRCSQKKKEDQQLKEGIIVKQPLMEQIKKVHVISEFEENKKEKLAVKEENAKSEELKFSIKLVEMRQE